MVTGADWVTEPSVALMVTPPGFNPDSWLTDTN